MSVALPLMALEPPTATKKEMADSIKLESRETVAISSISAMMSSASIRLNKNKQSCGKELGTLGAGGELFLGHALLENGESATAADFATEQKEANVQVQLLQSSKHLCSSKKNIRLGILVF